MEGIAGMQELLEETEQAIKELQERMQVDLAELDEAATAAAAHKDQTQLRHTCEVATCGVNISAPLAVHP